MNIDTVKLVYFSPTGTTAKILNGIAEGLGADNIEQMDLTRPGTDPLKIHEIKDELVVFGVPVYEGRVSKTAVPRLKQLKAHNTPAVVVVVYGNRDYEDALIELSDLTRELGFLPLAGGAFIGEHSFANENRPMANGRPDTRDLTAAREFGTKIRTKIDSLGAVDGAAAIALPGNKYYIERDRSALADKAATTIEDTCTLCGQCEPLCPVGAITVSDTVKTESISCILCNACVKNCPEGARVVDDPMVNKIANWVSKNFQARRDPEWFV